MRDLIRQKIVDGVTEPPPSFTKRNIRLPQVPGKAIAIIGMRRTGKTTFLWQVLSDKLNAKIPRESLLYFGFEDERLAGIKATDLYLLVEEYYRLYPEWRDKREVVFFLDEIQVVPNWEVFVRRIIDTERIEVLLSGSSAKLLSRELENSMRGRAMEVVIYPFSFLEYLRYFDREPVVFVERLSKADRSVLERDLQDYLTYGGFPETLGLQKRDRIDLLRSYVDVVLLRDVIERYNVSQPIALRWLVRQLLGNAAGFFSVHKFYNDLRSQGFRISKDTLHAYLSYLQDAFLIGLVEIATASERKRMVNPRKVYPIDTGSIPIFDIAVRANIGHALETAVFWELKRRGAEVHYVRISKAWEVDFLARFPEGDLKLIQVCADISEPAVFDREVRALLEASKEYPQATPDLITLEVPPHIESPPAVNVRVASSWFLANKGWGAQRTEKGEN